MAESLRIVSSQMDSPNVPGVGQARIVKLFSPFHAEKDAIVIVARDPAGYQAAANRIWWAFWSQPPLKQPVNDDTRKITDRTNKPPEKSMKSVATRGEVALGPYQMLTPFRRVERLKGTCN